MNEKPVILCVDDEINVIESMRLNLQTHYSVLTASSGPEGLELLKEHNDVAVVVSDMRMPDMDGAEFLAAVRTVLPSAVRMLLTGYSEIDAAMRAVNEGQIFRFLTKPCETEHLIASLESAVEQHKLVTAERVLLQQTLLGSVKAVVEVMGLDNPMALGRAVRIRNIVRRVAKSVALEASWRVEFAALLSQLGVVLLSDETVRKLYEGEAPSADERRQFARSIGRISKIIGNIPRLGSVTKLLDALRREIRRGSKGAIESLELQILVASIEYDAGEASGKTASAVIAGLEQTPAAFSQPLLDAFRSLGSDPEIEQVSFVLCSELRDGMVLCEDIKTSNGILILPRGFAINESSREHVKSFADDIAGRIRVRVAAEKSNDMNEDRLSA